MDTEDVKQKHRAIRNASLEKNIQDAIEAMDSAQLRHDFMRKILAAYEPQTQEVVKEITERVWTLVNDQVERRVAEIIRQRVQDLDKEKITDIIEDILEEKFRSLLKYPND